MKVEYEEGKKLVMTHVCGELDCGKPLVLTWVENAYNVRCNTHPESTEFHNIPTITQLHDQGEPLPVYVEDAIEKRRLHPSGGAIMTVEHLGKTLEDVKDAGTDRRATPDQVKALIEFAGRYSLDVYRKHVCLMYGEPYIEIDGLFFLAKQTGEFNGVSSRPLMLEEKTSFGYEPTDQAWVANVYRKGCDHAFVGRHRVLQAQIDEMTKDGKEYRYPVLRKWPDRICEKQAIRFALRAAFPDMPVWESETEGD